MSFLTPFVASVAAAIAIPSLLILYFLKLRRRDVEISTTLLWKKTIQDMQANAPFQRLRKNILLFLQLLALAAALFALAQPEIADTGEVGVKRVILIDRSASMNAFDVDEGSRLDEAKRLASLQVDAMREATLFSRGTGQSDEAMIIAFGTSAEVLQTFTSDKAALKRAIESIEPTDTPSRLEDAVALARAHLPRRQFLDDVGGTTDGTVTTVEGLVEGGVSMHLYSDGQLPDATTTLTGVEDSVEFIRVGRTDAANVGITGFSAEREFDDPRNLKVFVGLANSGPRPTRVELELLIDGIPAAISEVTIPAALPIDAGPAQIEANGGGNPGEPGINGVIFPIERAEGGIFAASITVLDDALDSAEGLLPRNVLPTDDRAWAVVPPARQAAVAFVTPTGNPFISDILRVLPLARLVQFSPSEWQASGDKSDFDIVITHDWLPDATSEGMLPPGRWLTFGPVPQDASLTAGEPQRAQLIDWQRDHPVMRLLNLNAVYVAEMPRLTIAEDARLTTLATATNGPAILELIDADTRAMIVPFDVLKSDWPLKTSWAVFLAASVRYLGLDVADDSGTTRSIQPGDTLADRLPADASDIRISDPNDGTTPLTAAADGSIAFSGIQQVGLYEATWDGTPSTTDAIVNNRALRPYAANLFDTTETDVRSQDTLALASTVVNATAGGEAEVRRRIWPWLVLITLAVLTFEWWVYNRKVYL